MSDDDKRPAAPAIPSWQQSSAEQNPAMETEPRVVYESGGAPKDDTDRTQEAFSREEVIRFLEDPVVKNAPDEKKRLFLESKGVSREVVDELLSTQAAQPETTTESQTFDVAQFKSQTSAPARDSPPIVTYPEFLVKPQKPPPLVTMSRLLNTAYVAGSLAAAFYGVSKYLVEPMTANLTEARHDFATHAHERVKGLNEKLEPRVSSLPSTRPNPETINDGESITSDPTELFYHDIGVQTSPPASRRSSTTDSSFATEADASTTHRQERHLKKIKTHLDGVLDVEESDCTANGTLSTSVQDLREYLNGLIYSPPATIEYGMWSAPGGDKAKKDSISLLRDEIRGVKGVLLSARRFPVPTRAA